MGVGAGDRGLIFARGEGQVCLLRRLFEKTCPYEISDEGTHSRGRLCHSLEMTNYPGLQRARSPKKDGGSSIHGWT